MYTLTLTADERCAIDWVGFRYPHGDTLRDLLCTVLDLQCGMGDEGDVDAVELWAGKGDVLFIIPENVAWQIADTADEGEGRWPCFASPLCRKLDALVDAIV